MINVKIKLPVLFGMMIYTASQLIYADSSNFLTNKLDVESPTTLFNQDRQYQFLLKKMFNVEGIENEIFTSRKKKQSALKHLKRYQSQGRYSNDNARLIPTNAVISKKYHNESYQHILKMIKEDLSDRGYVNYSKRPASKKSITDFKMVTNNFFETSLRDALNEVSQQVEIPFLMDESLQGTITVKFDDTPLDKALEMMLVSGGYDYVENDDYILIGFPQSTSPIFNRLSHTKVLHPVYALPTYISSLLSPDYKNFIKVNDDNNTIVITAPEKILKRVLDDIAAIDHRPAQIKLEVLIADITKSAKRKMGRDLWNDGVYGVGTFGGTPFDIQSTAEDGFTINVAPKGADLLKTIGGEAASLGGASALKYFTGVINAMEDTGEARVWAKPSVVASDGKLAVIDISTEQIVPITSGPKEFLSVSTKTFNSGVLMRIVPRISINGEINLDILEVKVSTVAFTGERQQGKRLPVKTSRRISTNVALKNQETLIIGGLLDIQHGDDAKYFPGMKSASPLLGTNKQTRETRDLVIFITPTLLHEHASIKKVENFL